MSMVEGLRTEQEALAGHVIMTLTRDQAAEVVRAIDLAADDDISQVSDKAIDVASQLRAELLP